MIMGSSYLPKLWLFTDKRNSHNLRHAIRRLPPHSAIIFRDYHLGKDARLNRFQYIMQLAQRRRHMAFLAVDKRNISESLYILHMARQEKRARKKHIGLYISHPFSALYYSQQYYGQQIRPQQSFAKRRYAHPLALAIHNEKESRAANHLRPDLIFLSPAFRTNSHKGKRALNRQRLGRIIKVSHAPIILLGGMNTKRWEKMQKIQAHGWGAIDGLSGSL